MNRMTTPDRRLCYWGVFCGNPAVALVTHPVLDPAPACQRCIDRWLLHDSILRRLDTQGAAQ